MKKIITIIFLIFWFNNAYADIDNNLVKKIVIDYQVDYENNKNYYEKNFIVLKSIDFEASINPYYLLKIKNNINKSEIHKRSFIYILNKIKSNLKIDKNYYSDYKNKIYNEVNKKYNIFDNNIINDELKKFLEINNASYLSKNDLNKMKNYILKNKIWIDSKYFLNYLKYSNFINNLDNKLFIKKDINQKRQEQNLSCEINSASLFASYLLKNNISENDILKNIYINDKKIIKNWNKYFWWNPDIEFVWDINWNQTKNLDNITWYWVHAWPISKSLKELWINAEILSFNKDNIINSLLNDKPIIFWYISKNKAWKLNTNPIKWYKNNWEEINWYIWEHTWLITWISFFDNWDVDNVYFYEGKNKDLQSIPFYELSYQASFFDKIIVSK